MVCFHRYYKEGFHCQKCDESCELCTGAGPESCRTCPAPLLEVQGTRLCVERCPPRFYQMEESCKQCHTSCLTCTGTEKEMKPIFIFAVRQHLLYLFDFFYMTASKDSSPQSCLTCDWGNILKDKVCYPRCEEGQYFSEQVCSPDWRILGHVCPSKLFLFCFDSPT